MQLRTFKYNYTINHALLLSRLFVASLLITVIIGPRSLCIRTAGWQFAPAAPQTTPTASGNLLLLLAMWRRSGGRAESPSPLLPGGRSRRMKPVTPPETRPMIWTGTTRITSAGQYSNLLARTVYSCNADCKGKSKKPELQHEMQMRRDFFYKSTEPM